MAITYDNSSGTRSLVATDTRNQVDVASDVAREIGRIDRLVEQMIASNLPGQYISELQDIRENLRQSVIKLSENVQSVSASAGALLSWSKGPF